MVQFYITPLLTVVVLRTLRLAQLPVVSSWPPLRRDQLLPILPPVRTSQASETLQNPPGPQRQTSPHSISDPLPCPCPLYRNFNVCPQGGVSVSLRKNPTPTCQGVGLTSRSCKSSEDLNQIPVLPSLRALLKYSFQRGSAC